MTVNWQDHIDALHSVLEVPAVLNVGTSEIDLHVIDKTYGYEVPATMGTDIQTVRPAVVVKMTTLIDEGVALEDLRGSTIEVEGRTYRIHSYLRKPFPEGGSEEGQVVLLLKEGS